MKNLIGIINILSIVLIILGLINPKIIGEIFRKTFTRKKVILVFGITWIISLIFWNIMSPKTNNNETSKQTEISIKNEDGSVDKQKLIDKITSISHEKYSNFEVSIWDEESNSGINAKVPFEIVLNAPLNGTSFSNCDEAKRTAYYIVEALYKDTDIRNNISRVLVSFPNYLRVSLGSTDGVKMADNNVFSGPTNFWKVLNDTNMMTEKETGDWNTRTWGSFLKNCQ